MHPVRVFLCLAFLGLVAVWAIVMGEAFVAFVLVTLAGAGYLLARRERSALRRVGVRASVGQEPLTGLLLLPTLTGLATQSPRISLVLLVIAAIWSHIMTRQRRMRPATFIPSRSLPALLMGLVILAAWMRGPLDATAVFTAGSVALITWIVAMSSHRLSPNGLLLQLSEGLGVYLVISVALYLVGLRAPTEGLRLAGLSNSTGLVGERLLFPLATEHTIPASVAAGFLAAVPALSLVPGSLGRRFPWIAGGAAAYVLMAAGYRGPLAFGVLAGTLSFVRPAFFARVFPLFAVVLLLMPVWYETMAAPVSATIRTIRSTVPGLDRMESDGSELSNREEVWARSIDAFWKEPTSAQLMGYGSDGQVDSGASKSYGPLFNGFLQGDATRLISPHNSALQVLFDVGLLGLVVFVAAMFMILRRLKAAFRRGSPQSLAALAALTAFAVVGATSVVMAPTTFVTEPMYFMLACAVAVCFGAPREYSDPPGMSVGRFRDPLSVGVRVGGHGRWARG